MSSLDRTYKIEQPPFPAMSWEKYQAHVESEWKRLLASEDSRIEGRIQSFLEQHPSLIPGCFSLPLPSGHYPFPEAVISQPPLRGIRTKVPDFMWLATDSKTLYPVLIEIEIPSKRWFTEKGTPHSDLTQALDQLATWKQWFGVAENKALFLKTYKVPLDLQEKAFHPLFVLIYGSRDEFKGKPGLNAKREYLQRPDEYIMTFNRLSPEPKADELMCVQLVESVGDSQYVAVSVPATLSLSPSLAEERALISNKAKAIQNNPLISPERKAFLLSRLDYWDEWAKQGRHGIISLGDRE
ncbi:MAG: DUF4263 domain-containing protein [Nitrospira sp.]|nr:DUF4263 domain-containing protein [Nitrospira sp.]